MKISVFGGSQPKTGSPAYEEARQLGELLAQHGHTVLTGGYIGTMEAVSHGASEAGGHAEIERWRNVGPNQWVKEERRNETLIERMQVLIRECDAAIALSGGVGTLTEIMLMWNLMIVESMHRRPLVLVGGGWQSVFDQFLNLFSIYIPDNKQELVSFTKDVSTAVKIMESGLQSLPTLGNV